MHILGRALARCTAGARALVAASLGLSSLHLALTSIRGLGAVSARRAAADASRGFAAGVVAPTELVLLAVGVLLLSFGTDSRRC